ncbi:MAG TPA: glycosyltransferase family 2 protein [Nitrospirota bacterium]|jgi:GT2 family glycosyltransferase
MPEYRETDIIVPVYNAPEDLRECVDSVLKHTDAPYRLVIIDDNSTDGGVSEYLDALERRGLGNVVIKRNGANLGFVGTVNRGMGESGSDVVLLNSDTVVTPGWLGRMRECAYSDPSVASVTPLTNNGTICSVPNFCEDNALPDGLTAEGMAGLVERVSMRAYPRVPTGVGFCMLIKREALNEVGLFDQETFGRGYAEENDWCCRAKELGWTHAADDATFIYHKGAMSFKGDKERLIEANLKLLVNKYPYFFEMIDRFIADNPLYDIQENIRFRFSHAARKGPAVLVVHGPADGVEKWAGLSGYEFYSLVCYGGTLTLRELCAGGTEYRFRLPHAVDIPSYSHAAYGDAVEKIIATFKISAAVVEGLNGHSLEFFKAARRAGIPYGINYSDAVACPAGDCASSDGDYAACLRAARLAGNPDALLSKWRNAVMDAVSGAAAVAGAIPAEAAVKGFGDITGRAGKFLDTLGVGETVASGREFSWREISESRAWDDTRVRERYTEKQRQAFDYMISLANKNRKALGLAKALYQLLRGR